MTSMFKSTAVAITMFASTIPSLAMPNRAMGAEKMTKAEFQKLLECTNAGDQKCGSHLMALEMPLAKQGDIDSQRDIGVLYLKGVGTEKDLVKAAYWFKKAAEQGDPNAQYHLAILLANDEGGVPLDFVKAYMWASLSTYPDAPRIKNAIADALAPDEISKAEQEIKKWKKAHSGQKTASSKKVLANN